MSTPNERTKTSGTGAKVISAKEATPATREANAAIRSKLPFNNREDFENARRGFIDTIPNGSVAGPNKQPAWDLNSYQFLQKDEAPATVNPSLWRQGQLNLVNGLFKVADRIYQVRGLDLSNMTIIEGDTGLIVIDPLLSAETAKTGLDLYFKHFPRRPIVAVIYSHCHVDHFGGVKGIITEEDARSGKVPVLAPEGFLEHAVSENVFAGNAMGRRSIYMYGSILPKNERGQVDAGLGKTNSIGSITLIAPTDILSKTGEKRRIDGVEMIFQMAPGTEAPAEMLIYFPQFRALCAAEDMTHNLHNLYTLRGAEVRDAAHWWKTINEAIDLFGDKTDVVFAQHHWPTWGTEKILNFFSKQRDMYKYLNDQSLRLMNEGYTMLEVAEMVKLPTSLANEWYNRGYYGSVNHNVKAIYQKYLGFYSSNPSDLHPLPPEEAAKKYVEFMGGVQTVMEKARKAFDKGEYRWTAEVMKHVVFADPGNEQARQLLADTFEQLGYQAENGTWRNEYLMGALELRQGVPNVAGAQTDSPDVAKAMTIPMYFDYLGVRLNGPKADGKQITINWNITDIGEQYAMRLENCALTYSPNKQLPKADVTLTLRRATLDEVNIGTITIDQAVNSGAIRLEGNKQKLKDLFSCFDTFQQMFNIVTP